MPNEKSPGEKPLAIAFVRQHIPGLDGLRGLAAIMVMFFHFQWPITTNPFLRIAFRTTKLGQDGVDLFFVLSGFLITGILLSTKGAPHYLKTFYSRRILRIFPLYYGVVLVTLLVVPLLLHRPVIMGRLVTFLFYSWNIVYTFSRSVPWVQASVPVLPGHFWSLCIEEQFYMCWPFVVLFLDKKHLPKVLAGFVVLSILSRILLVSLGYSAFYFTLCRLDALSLGAMLAVAFPDPRVMARYVKHAAWASVIMVAIFLPMYVAFSGDHLPVMQVIKFTVIAAFFAAVLVMVVGVNKRNIIYRFFNSWLLRFCGKISYALYVFHPFVFFFISMAFLHLFGSKLYAGTGWVFTARLVISFAMTILVAFLSWHLYEKQFLKLKRFCEYEPRSAAAPPL